MPPATAMPTANGDVSVSLSNAKILWQASELLPVVIAGGVCLLSWIVLCHWRSRPRRGFAHIALLARIAGIVLLLACLLQPNRVQERPRPQANLFPIVVDESTSMTAWGAESQATERQLRELLSAQSSWRVALGQLFDVRSYTTARQLNQIADYESLELSANASSLGAGLQMLQSRFSERPVAGVLLFTDGNATDPERFAELLAGTSNGSFPIYPVLPEASNASFDMRVGSVTVTQTDFESAPTTLTAEVFANGGDRAEYLPDCKAILMGPDSNVVEEQNIRWTAASPADIDVGAETRGECTFRFRPDAAGMQFHRLVVSHAGDLASLKRILAQGERIQRDTPSEHEMTLVNNQQDVLVDRGGGPYRILYIAGRPNWEFKFLRRAMASDAEVELVGLLRIARREPKFSFRDSFGGNTNPLFAGLGDDDEETAEQYDEPVLVRFGVEDDEELRDGFPKTDEDLFRYHGLVIDDLEPDFFTADQMALLRRFVSDRGGGMLLLGGEESFDANGFARSVLGELSPVYAPKRSQAAAESTPARLVLTRDGWLQPFARLRRNRSSEEQRISALPPVRLINPVGQSKPGSVTLMSAESAASGAMDNAAPVLVAQRFGRGRTMAMLAGDLWRHTMRRPVTRAGAAGSADGVQRDDAARAWRQTLRYVIGDTPQPIELTTDDEAGEGQFVDVNIEVRDDSFRSVDDAIVKLEVTAPDGQTFSMVGRPSEKPGRFTCRVWASQSGSTMLSGAYRLAAKATARDESALGAAEAGWVADPDGRELASLAVNRDALASLAEASGGRIIRSDELDDFVSGLASQDYPVMETHVFPLWHAPWVIAAALLLLCFDWGIRRWLGMA
ncbi:MAG: vWA domain-containing protein [Planctomycetota bacterium]